MLLMASSRSRHSHSYDAFARYHLGGLLYEGYAGRHHAALVELERRGAERSLAWQMSDGSLPSAHRSTGQSWTDAIQIAFFARQLAPNCPIPWSDDQKKAFAIAAQRAYASLVRWQRSDGSLSPVQNTFSGHDRVGYQGYTFEGNYASLALAFLADALAYPDWQQPISEAEPAHTSSQTLIAIDRSVDVPWLNVAIYRFS